MSIKNVFNQIVSFENILKAEKSVRVHKQYNSEILRFWSDYEANLHQICDSMKSINLPPDVYRSFYVYIPKLRKVIYADHITKIVHRALYDVLNPILCKGFIDDTYSCVAGRGPLKAMERLAKWVNYVSKGGGKWYYLKMDVTKFFYRIDHDVLMKLIRKKICDKKTVAIMEHYICNASRPFGLPLGISSPLEIDDKDMLWDVGIAIGGGLSHMYGNLYLDPLDQMAKRDMSIAYYTRYMDDIIVLSPSKDELNRYKNIFSEFLNDELKLQLNNKTAIRPIEHGIEYVGYRIRPNCVRLRKSTSLRMKRGLKKTQEMYRDYEIELDRVHSTVASYKAMMKHCDCRALEKKIFDDFVLTHSHDKEGT